MGRGTVEPIAEGKKGPAFTLADKDGSKIQLSQIESDYVVLFFYPKDNTPGCTIEAKGLSDISAKLKKLGAMVIGISGGDAASKEKFCKKHNLKVDLVSDEDFSVSKKYGVYGKKSFMGKTFDGIHRTTFILDRNRKIIKLFDKVKPAEHPAEVLDFLKTATKGK